jgi:hypothetical protein
MNKTGMEFSYFKCLKYVFLYLWQSSKLNALTFEFYFTSSLMGCIRSAWNIVEAMILHSEMSGSQQPVARPPLNASSLVGLRLLLKNKMAV